MLSGEYICGPLSTYHGMIIALSDYVDCGI